MQVMGIGMDGKIQCQNVLLETMINQHNESIFDEVTVNACVDYMQELDLGIQEVYDLYQLDYISQRLMARFAKAVAVTEKQKEVARYLNERVSFDRREVVEQIVRKKVIFARNTKEWRNRRTVIINEVNAFLEFYPFELANWDKITVASPYSKEFTGTRWGLRWTRKKRIRKAFELKGEK